MENPENEIYSAKEVAKAYCNVLNNVAVTEVDLENLIKKASAKLDDTEEAIRIFDQFASYEYELWKIDVTMGLNKTNRIPVLLSFNNMVASERALGIALNQPIMLASIPSFNLIFFKITWVLGIDDILPDIEQFFAQRYGQLMGDIKKALEQKNYKRAKRLLKRLLGIFMTDEFGEWLISIFGKERAERILKKIGLKFIPGIGWIITAGMIVAAIVGQLFL